MKEFESFLLISISFVLIAGKISNELKPFLIILLFNFISFTSKKWILLNIDKSSKSFFVISNNLSSFKDSFSNRDKQIIPLSFKAWIFLKDKFVKKSFNSSFLIKQLNLIIFVFE